MKPIDFVGILWYCIIYYRYTLVTLAKTGVSDCLGGNGLFFARKPKYKICVPVCCRRRTAIILKKSQSKKKQVLPESGMTDKELKRLSRSELLELLLQQTKEVERLTIQLEKTEKMLCNRYLQVQKAGDLANAVLAINGVMTSAQEAAQQYLDNIQQMEKDTSVRCAKMLLAARREAARILKEAKETAAVSRPRAGSVQAPPERKNR